MKPKRKDQKSKTVRKGSTQATSLKDLQHDELSGSKEDSSLNSSDDDEGANEGSGDGTIGRSSRNIIGK